MTAMILAAGRGKRLRPLTDATPKPLIEVAGVTLIERHLHRLAAAGVTHVVINVDWLGEQIMEFVGDGQRFGLQASFSPEFGNVLETAGGIQKALPMLGQQPFWVINADVFSDADLVVPVMKENESGHLFMVETPAFKEQGDFDLRDGNVINASKPLLTFSGIAYYKPEFFAALDAGPAALAPLLRAAADRGALGGSMLSGRWEDVGTPERLATLQDSLVD